MQTPIPPIQHAVIFAVDDEEDDIALMRILFRKAGITYTLEVYRKGEDLIAALSAVVKKSVAAVKPLLCFLDVKMPCVNGHEVLRWIRQQPQLDAVSVVMMSSSDHPADIKQAAENGAQCYLAKYPQPAVLKSVVDEAERVATNGLAAANEWFGLPANLLLRWGFATARS